MPVCAAALAALVATLLGFAQGQPQITAVRLVGGSWEGEGRLEVQLDTWGDTWGTICGSSNFEQWDAQVVCRTLNLRGGLPNATFTDGVHFEAPPPEQPVLLDDFGCGDPVFREVDIRDVNISYCSYTYLSNNTDYQAAGGVIWRGPGRRLAGRGGTRPKPTHDCRDHTSIVGLQCRPAEDARNPGSCAYLNNTLLAGSYTEKVGYDWEEMATQADCCKRCSASEDCGFWSYCPSDIREGCYNGEFMEESGACLLHQLTDYYIDGGKARVVLQGEETTFVSGMPEGKPLPRLPKPVPEGECAPYANTMLVSGYELDNAPADSEEACCSRCNNFPECNLWNYCTAPDTADEEGSCFTTTGTGSEPGGTCVLYSLSQDEDPEADQQGPETQWVAGLRNVDWFAVPDVNATAPAECNKVPNTLLEGSYIARFNSIESVDTCCMLCRNTPACRVWSFCGAGAEEAGCYKAYDELGDPGECILYNINEELEVDIVQRGAETLWTSGWKWEQDNTLGLTDAPPEPIGCSTEQDTWKYGDNLLETNRDIETEEACCARCTNTPRCTFFTYCPADVDGEGCPSGSDSIYYANPGECRLYEQQTENADLPTVKGEGTLWVSGAVKAAS